jgi:chromosome partitioning protein
MIIAVVSQKGGVGKSTVAVCVACELLARGRRVLLVDADPQLTTTTWHDVAVEGGHVTPSVVSMTGTTLHQPHQLPQLAAGYDHIVIDTPPRLGAVLKSALMVCDLALLPCGPTAPDAWAMAETLDVIEEARILRPNLQAAIVINRKRAGTALADKARKALGTATVPVLLAELGLRQTYPEAIGAGKAPAAYAPSDAAAREVRALVDELIEVNGMKDTKETIDEGSSARNPQAAVG